MHAPLSSYLDQDHYIHLPDFQPDFLAQGNELWWCVFKVKSYTPANYKTVVYKGVPIPYIPAPYECVEKRDAH
jgi:hypothetical protein